MQVPTPRELAARLIVAGFPEPEVSPHARRLIEAGVSGLVLFARNLPPESDPRELTAALKSHRGHPLLLCVDQEGGRVARLRGPMTAVPSMRAIGGSGDVSLARAAGTVLGAECRWAGFDVNFAPVVDVDSNPANPVIADRSFARNPDTVCAFAVEHIRAMQACGVAACAKHFPGHGDTAQDSHHDLPRLDHDLARLRSVELPPFAAAIGAGVASIMSAHVVFTPLDPDFPATMSERSLGRILRDEMRFGGVVFSDDLEMKALAGRFDLEDQLLRGFDAGIDLFLICHHEELQFRAIEILAGAIEDGRIPRVRLRESLDRVMHLTATYHRPPNRSSGPLGDLHRSLAAERSQLARLTAQAPASTAPTASTGSVPPTPPPDPTEFQA
jgi:beta-N-acetylhexosaminidase